jgi:CHASE3 domain sensor protein
VVLAEVESTFRHLLEAHSDMRGYIITGEPAFAQAYDHAVAVLPSAIGKLRSLVRDLGQQKRLARIEKRSARLLGFLVERTERSEIAPHPCFSPKGMGDR